MPVLAGANNMRVIRRPENPLDKCTIVSVYPEKVVEDKPTTFPGKFIIPAAPRDGFSLLVVGGSSWFKELEEGQPHLEINSSSIIVAESIIKDYCNGLFGYNGEGAMPGLFFIPGDWDEKTIRGYVDIKTKETFIQLLEKARQKQKNWWNIIVEKTDILWLQTSGNPRSVSKDARIAADHLGYTKAWMKDLRTFKQENCKFCGTMINPDFPICPNCKNILDHEKAKVLGLAGAIK